MAKLEDEDGKSPRASLSQQRSVSRRSLMAQGSKNLSRVRSLNLKKSDSAASQGSAGSGGDEEDEEDKKKKKPAAKGKKGKKGKGKETQLESSEPAAPKPFCEFDVMEELYRIREEELLRAQEAAEAEELAAGAKGLSETIIGPDGKPKKLSKKERQKLEADLARQAKIQAELNAAREEEEAKLRLVQEYKANVKKQKRDMDEQIIRCDQLASTIQRVKEMIKKKSAAVLKDLEHQEWDRYLKCDGLPDPSKCGQMNTYLHLWEKVMDATTMKEAEWRTEEILGLLGIVDDLIDQCSIMEEIDQMVVGNWIWVRSLFREFQAKSLNVASYKLVRNIQNNLERVSIPRADYNMKHAHFAISLWLLVQLPTPIPPQRPPVKPRVSIDFPNMKLNALFPQNLQLDRSVVRCMYVKYDHLSDLAPSYKKPPCPEQFAHDLDYIISREWQVRMKYKFFNKDIAEKGETDPDGTIHALPLPASARDNLMEPVPEVPYQKLFPTPSNYAIAVEESLAKKVGQDMAIAPCNSELNLRKYKFLGGAYYVELFEQPPQAIEFVSVELEIVRLYLPKELKPVPFYVPYKPPPPPEAGATRLPEEIEEEMKKQEALLDNLILITVSLPEHVLWFDTPLVCHWNPQKSMWSSADVHDVKHNEEKGLMTFRSGIFGCFAMASYRYSNLPFQTWELKPELNGTITFQLTAAILVIEFNVRPNKTLAVTQLQNVPNKCLNSIIGVYMILGKMKRTLQDKGVDVFPDFDAFCYVEGSAEKHWPMERHLYYNMAQLCPCYNFTWSRWNMTAGRRSAILQMREYKPEKTKQVLHSTLLVTPLKVLLVNCTEISQTFTDEPLEDMKFYPDLYCLMKGISSMALRTKLKDASPELLGTVADLLLATRVLSFS